MLWWVEGVRNSCSSRNISLNAPCSAGSLCNCHPWRTTPSNVSRERGTALKAPPEILPSPGFKAKPLPFHRPSGMSGLPALGSLQQRCAFPAGVDDPVDQRLLTGSLSACLVSKYKPISGNLPFPLGQAEEQCLCCDRLLISLLLPIPQMSHAQKRPFPFLKAWVFVLLDFFFFSYACWPYIYIRSSFQKGTVVLQAT